MPWNTRAAVSTGGCVAHLRQEAAQSFALIQPPLCFKGPRNKKELYRIVLLIVHPPCKRHQPLPCMHTPAMTLCALSML